MSSHRAGPQQSTLLLVGVLGVVVALLVGILALADRGVDAGDASGRIGVTMTSAPETAPPRKRPSPSTERLPVKEVQPGHLIQRVRGPVLAEASTGRVGTGLALGPIAAVDAPVGGPVQGPVTASVANLPNRTSDGGFASSMGTLTSSGPDFVMLNEVSRRSIDGIRASAPGYDAYRDPQPDRSTGGSQSMNNVVMWRTDRWTLVDAGRVKVVDNDTGYLTGQAFTWDRYATWAVLQRKDGAIVSVVSAHMPTNPAKFPRQPGNPGMTRVERYSRGMDVLRATVGVLAEHGPVLLGGDMNSHHSQGAWTAAAKMTAAGYRYAKDRGVMHLFYPGAAELVSNNQVGVASDHPAIVTTLDMNGQGPS
jgi:endonuclease/exonuclease/phosphatase family metal-dependent hydrolase